MNDMVATKAQDTPTSVTSSQARRNDRDQGCRISSGPAVLCRTKGRTYDRSRPKRSDRRNPLAKRPSTYDVAPAKASEPNCIPRPEERAFQDRRFIFEEIGKRNDVMNDMVATKAQDTPTSVTSSQARRNDRDQGCRISSGPAVLCRTKGRTYDRSRPKRSDRRNPLAKRPSTYDVDRRKLPNRTVYQGLKKGPSRIGVSFSKRLASATT